MEKCFEYNLFGENLEWRKNQNPEGRIGATFQLNSTANLANLAHFLSKWAGLTVLFSW